MMQHRPRKPAFKGLLLLGGFKGCLQTRNWINVRSYATRDQQRGEHGHRSLLNVPGDGQSKGKTCTGQVFRRVECSAPYPTSWTSVRVKLVSSIPTYSLFEGPNVKCHASCWNQLAMGCFSQLWPTEPLDFPRREQYSLKSDEMFSVSRTASNINALKRAPKPLCGPPKPSPTLCATTQSIATATPATLLPHTVL